MAGWVMPSGVSWGTNWEVSWGRGGVADEYGGVLFRYGGVVAYGAGAEVGFDRRSLEETPPSLTKCSIFSCWAGVSMGSGEVAEDEDVEEFEVVDGEWEAGAAV